MLRRAEARQSNWSEYFFAIAGLKLFEGAISQNERSNYPLISLRNLEHGAGQRAAVGAVDREAIARGRNYGLGGFLIDEISVEDGRR
jgi:hypothetical protein